LLGDNAYASGTDVEYQSSFFQVYADDLAQTPLWPCIGNHDQDDAYQYLFSVNQDGKAGGFPSRNPYYYSFDIANLHVVVLDPWKLWLQVTGDRDYAPWQRQLEWLKQDLAANKQDWTVVINHFPMYCDGNYNSDDNAPLADLRELLVPLAEEHGVDLFIAGHDHTYQRSYLIDGHYGQSTTFDPARHIKAPGDGRDAPLIKKRGPHGGTMYLVSGTAGGMRPHGKFAHPALIPFPHEGGQRNGFAIPGSLVIEIEGSELRGWQVGIEGQVFDQFKIRKSE
jgi:acid phosphatase type 7